MRKFIFIAAAVLTLSSCDDLITLYPESQLTADAYFRTEADLRLFTNPLYNNLLDKECFAKESDVFVSKTPANNILGTRVVPATGGGWSWTNLRRINTLLGNIDKCADEKAVKEYTALALFWRAYFYFDKIQRFGDVPWIDHELGSAEDILFDGRDSRETVMQHMIEDIDVAIADLPEPFAKPYTPFRVNKYTAMFLKAQFCLFEGTFRKYHSAPAPFADSYKAADGSTHDYKWYLNQSILASEMLMDSKKYSLYATGHPDSDYRTMFQMTDFNGCSEMILAINFDNVAGIFHDATREFTSQSINRYGMTKKLVDQYLMKDGTRFTDKPGWDILPFDQEVKDRDPRLAQTIRTESYSWQDGKHEGPELRYCMTGYQSTKYVLPYSYKATSATTSYNDLPVYRYAEVLLNYAEAKAESGSISQEEIDKSVNLIRKRVGMPDLKLAGLTSDKYLLSEETGYPNVKGDPQEAVILEIRRERAIELFQEGSGRYYDLMRWKAGYCISQPMFGFYIPGPGDYSYGDKSSYTFYVDATNTPKEKYRIFVEGVPVTDDTVYLWDPNTKSYSTSGNLVPLKATPCTFDEEKDYFYPINEYDIQLNTNLKQNPNW